VLSTSGMGLGGDTPAGPLLALGVTLPTGPLFEIALQDFSCRVGRVPQIGSFYTGWAYGGFDAASAAVVRAWGATPMVSWEPWDFRGGADQQRFSLVSITAGDHDGYVRDFADQVKRFGSPVLIRFAHEMNGNWYPWAVGVNGITAFHFIDAWRHIVRIFRQVGADLAQWVWSPNVDRGTSSPLTVTYPGDSFVDWIGLDGYNGGAMLPWGGWLSVEQIFGPSLTVIRALASQKPIMIAETGCVEAGGDKAAWIRDLFMWLQGHPEVAALVWFNELTPADWRVTTSEAARRAFEESLATFSCRQQ
jgi:beta-mannanase